MLRMPFFNTAIIKVFALCRLVQ